MQPYFFPYFQQFRHISQCDRWIVFDTVRYSRRTWVNRNRILDRCTGWTYLSAPVARGATVERLAEAELAAGPWRNDILQRLRVYEGEAPEYGAVRGLVERVLAAGSVTIADLDCAGLRAVCDHLGIATPIDRLSALALDLPAQAEPGEWALLIARALGADTYSNASGGRDLFDPARYRAAGVTLEFYEPIELTYPTGSFVFEPDLSVIDTLMWIAPAQLRLLVER